jgi:hypothetical protein
VAFLNPPPNDKEHDYSGLYLNNQLVDWNTRGLCVALYVADPKEFVDSARNVNTKQVYETVCGYLELLASDMPGASDAWLAAVTSLVGDPAAFHFMEGMASAQAQQEFKSLLTRTPAIRAELDRLMDAGVCEECTDLLGGDPSPDLQCAGWAGLEACSGICNNGDVDNIPAMFQIECKACGAAKESGKKNDGSDSSKSGDASSPSHTGKAGATQTQDAATAVAAHLVLQGSGRGGGWWSAANMALSQDETRYRPCGFAVILSVPMTRLL